MKTVYKSLVASFLALFIFCFNVSAQSLPSKNTFKADLQSKRIAAGTIIEIRFLDSMSSLTSTAGNSFNACLEEDIKFNKKTVLPAGTLMRGTVNNVKKSKILKIPAALYLDFDHLVTPDGKQLDLSLRLADVNLTKDLMGISGGGSYRISVCDNFSDSVEFVKNSVDWGNAAGDKFFNGYPKIIITPVTATGGFIGSTLFFTGKSLADIFIRGNEVIVNQNQVIKGRLTEPIDIPLY